MRQNFCNSSDAPKENKPHYTKSAIVARNKHSRQDRAHQQDYSHIRIVPRKQ